MTPRPRFPLSRPAWAAVAAVTLTAGPAAAATGTFPTGSPALLAGYWDRFSEYWLGGLKQQNGIVLLVLGAGLLSLLIITRGKWVK